MPFPDWVVQAVHQNEHAIEFPILALRLLLAFGLGCVAAAIHHGTSPRLRDDDERTLTVTLVLLPVLIAVVTTVIGSNLARAFSLVGALAIIRFRTVVEDPRDTAFVIYAVTCGMGAGAGYVMGPVMATPLVLLAAYVFRPRQELERMKPREGILLLRLSAGRPPDERLQAILHQHAGGTSRLTSLSTARGGSAFDATYTVTLPPPEHVYAMVAELSRIEGVQQVELKED